MNMSLRSCNCGGERLVGKKKEDEVWFDVIDSLPHDNKPQRHPSVVGLAMMVLQEEEEY
jgi:hypothetical protein